MLVQIIDLLLQENLYNFSTSIFLYNRDYKAVLVLQDNIKFNEFDELSFNLSGLGFKPFIKQSDSFVIIIVMFVVFLIFLIMLTILVARTMNTHLRDTLESRKLQIPWYDYLDLIVVVMLYITSILFIYIFLIKSEVYPIILKEVSEFTFWVEHITEVQTFNMISGITFLLIMIWMVRFIYTSFPVLGAVFRTVANAGNELLGFFSLIIVIFVVFVFATHISFGYYRKNYFDIFLSLLNIFLMFLGFSYTTDFEQVNNSNPIASYFLIGFNFLFSFIIFNIFLSLIRKSYIETKQRNDTFIEVYNLIVQEQSEEIRTNFMNLILFKEPVEVERKSNLTTEANLIVPENSDHDKIEPKQVEEKRKKSTASFWDVLRYNFSKLNIYGLLMETKTWDKEEFEAKKKKYVKVLEKNRMLQHLREVEVDFSAEFSLLSQTFVYITYIVVFMIMIFLQSVLRQSFENKTFLNKFFGVEKNKTSNFNNFNEVFEELNENLNIFYFSPSAISHEECMSQLRNTNTEERLRNLSPLEISKDKTTNKKEKIRFNNKSRNLEFQNFEELCSTYFNQCQIQSSLYLSAPFFRLNFRVSKYTLNDFENDNKFFNFKLDNPAPLDQANCASNSEITQNLKSRVLLGTGKEESINYKYRAPSEQNTAFNCGGFNYSANFTNPICYEEDNTAKPFLHINWHLFQSFFESIPLASVFVESNIINFGNNIFARIIFEYISQPDGSIAHTIHIGMLPVNLYNTYKDYTRLLFELAFLLFIIYQTTLLGSSVWTILNKEIKDDFKKKGKDLDNEKVWLEKYFELSFVELKNMNAFNAIFTLITQIVIYSIKFSFQLATSIYYYITESVFNFIDLTSLSLSYASISIWIYAITLNYQIDFNFVERYSHNEFNESENPNFNTLQKLENAYTTYSFLISINAFLLICRILRFLRFSKTIYSFIWVLKNSKVSIIFNITITFFVFFGYVLMGMIVYGQNISDFKNLSTSIFTVTAMLLGRIPKEQMLDKEITITIFYIISFYFFLILISLNLLASIIVESYYYIKSQQKKSDITNAGVYENLKIIILKKLEMFNDSCDLFYKNIIYFKDNIVKPSIENIEEEHKKLEEEKSFWFSQPKATQTAYFIQEIRNTYNKIFDLTINKKRKTNQGDVEVSNKGDFSNGFTIWKKIYVHFLYHSQTKLTKKVQNLFLKKDVPQLTRKNSEFKEKIKTSKSILTRMFSNVQKENDGNENFEKLFEDQYYQNMEKSKNEVVNLNLFSSSTLKDIYSQEFYSSLENLDSFSKLFTVKRASYEDLINAKLLIPCTTYPRCQEKLNCNCFKIDQDYKHFYNCFAKYFFVPNPINSELDLKIYCGLYLHLLKESNLKYNAKELENIITEIKFKNLADEVHKYLIENALSEQSFNVALYFGAFNFFMILSKKLDYNLIEEIYKSSELFTYLKKDSRITNEEIESQFGQFLRDKFDFDKEIKQSEKEVSYTINFEAYIINLINLAGLKDDFKCEQKYNQSYYYFHDKSCLGILVEEEYKEDINSDIKESNENFVYSINMILWEKFPFEIREKIYFGFNSDAPTDEKEIKDNLMKGLLPKGRPINFFTNYHKGYYYSMVGIPAWFSKKLMTQLKKNIGELTRKEIKEYAGDSFEQLMIFLVNENFNYDIYFDIIYGQIKENLTDLYTSKKETEMRLRNLEVLLKEVLHEPTKEDLEEINEFYQNFCSYKKIQDMKAYMKTKGLADKKIDKLEAFLLFASDSPINSLVFI